MTWRTPWAIKGGAKHGVELARTLAYAATSGNEGVLGPTDLTVKQTVGGATDQVRIQRGAMAALNRSVGSEDSGSSYHQMYIAINDADYLVDIPHTGSGGGRTDMLVARIEDPQYPPWEEPVDPVTADYARGFLITNVDPSYTSVDPLELSYPAVALARIVQPSSNSVVTDAMITDLRNIASPRSRRVLKIQPPTAEDVQDTGGPAGEWWPDGSQYQLDIPSWATRAKVVATYAQIFIPIGNAAGTLWVEIGYPTPATATEVVGYNTPNATSDARSTFVVADDIAIPAAIRGTTQWVMMKAALGSATPSSAKIKADAWSVGILDLEFFEAPDPDGE